MKMIGLALLAAASGCASSSNAPITQAEYDDVARSVGGSTATAGDTGAVADTLLLATGTMPAGFSVDPSGAFHGSHLGMNVTYTLKCPDQETTVPICTASADLAEVQLSWDGMLVVPSVSASVSRTGQWSLAHLRSPTIVLAGTGSFIYDAAITNAAGPVAYHFTYVSSYTHILVDKASLLANAGTIDYAIDATTMVNGAERSFTIDAEVTFHADATATFVLDGDHAYTVDLVTGVVASISPS